MVILCAGTINNNTTSFGIFWRILIGGDYLAKSVGMTSPNNNGTGPFQYIFYTTTVGKERLKIPQHTFKKFRYFCIPQNEPFALFHHDDDVFVVFFLPCSSCSCTDYSFYHCFYDHETWTNYYHWKTTTDNLFILSCPRFSVFMRPW